MISVIIPVYNVEQYLRQCIDSILSQTYQNLEIILIDDGSSDKSGIICEEYKDSHDNITVVHQDNKGLSAARNKGIEIAKGEFIAFIDSDDWVDSDMMEILVREIERSASHAVVNCQPVFVNEDETFTKWTITESKTIPSHDILKAWLSEESNHYIPLKLFRRCVFDHISFKEGRKDEDTLFTYELGKLMESKSWDMVELASTPYHYRQHPNSICHTSIGNPLRIDRLNNLMEIEQDLYAGHKELIPYVERLRIRTLEWFVTEVRNNPYWRERYLHQYTQEVRAIHNSIARESLNGHRYRLFLVANYCPVWAEKLARKLLAQIKRVVRTA